ncbi:MAG: tetratricopeptide repeat protein [Pseudomonadales bacterium]|nr:tetratricopeptide repeat protein [Pseudomonadales bacterium]
MSLFVRAVSTLLFTTLISGCSWLSFGLMGDDGPKEIRAKGPKLGRVLKNLPELEVRQVVAMKPTREEVMAAYNRVYGMLPNAVENHAVGKRLADLHMDLAQDQDIDGEADPYQAAVSLYEELLQQNVEGEGTDEILYQLARAYDLGANQVQAVTYLDRLISEYAESAFIPEARFRRAEIRFSGENYRSAAEDYQYVVDLGDTTPYYRNSAYMLGWSEFKRSRLDEGLHQFFNVIESLAANGEADALETIEVELLKDTFRVVNLALAYLDGAQTLADEMRKRNKPDWQYLAYENLADDYFEKERYLDNVATWQTFVEHNTLDKRAPAAHMGMVKTLMDAGFPSDVIPKKKEFVLRYGVYSEFWTHHTEVVRDSYIETLHGYLSELSKLAHAEAQAYAGVDAGGKRAKDWSETEQRQLYLGAAEWYEELIVTFPKDPRTAEFLFLLGESYTEAVEFGRAVASFQRVVREFPEFDRAHEAGYAAILGLSELVSTASAHELELWQRLKIDSQIEFALIFPGDHRAPAVQTDAANTLFALGHADEAIDLAENLLAEWPDVAHELRKTALLIIGHGKFEADNFVAAEAAYHELLAMTLEESERSKVHERLLAAVYKQAEEAELELDVDRAVHHYLRVAQLDPTAKLAVQANFDAIATLEGASRLEEAAGMLADFRSRFPKHELNQGSDLRLADMYEKTENWAGAAAEFLSISKSATNREVRQQSHYRAAELYLQLDDVPMSIELFRDYAHTWMQPEGLRMEAMHHMDTLYHRTGEADNRRFWLKKKIELHRSMGANAGERPTYLAASAQLVFAEDAKHEFERIRLTHPLKRSLKKKQRALKKTLKAYEATANYGVAEFTTHATFEIANLYTGLSKSIMASDRPNSLSELELAQYDILLEEQAFPFEEQAIGLHEINAQKAWVGVYDDWVKASFTELARLMPGRFGKEEEVASYAQAIH